MANVVHGYVKGQAAAQVEDAAGAAGRDALAEHVGSRKVTRHFILEQTLALKRGQILLLD